MFDLATLAQLMRGGDLPTAAKAIGLKQRTLTTSEEKSQAFVRTVNAALSKDPDTGAARSEVLFLEGQPAMLKGRKMRVIVVIGDFPIETENSC